MAAGIQLQSKLQ